MKKGASRIVNADVAGIKEPPVKPSTVSVQPAAAPVVVERSMIASTSASTSREVEEDDEVGLGGLIKARRSSKTVRILESDDECVSVLSYDPADAVRTSVLPLPANVGNPEYSGARRGGSGKRKRGSVVGCQRKRAVRAKPSGGKGSRNSGRSGR